ncbi:MAG: hypothetical protein KGK07_07005 [Chloroflexota bacterium]|nr:hypothetical protein [Chloroflexota bacterium]
MSRTVRLLLRFRPDDGITGVELAAIAGAIVLVSSLFAGVVLSTGTTASLQLEQTAQRALALATTGVQVDGPVLAQTDGTRATQVMVDLTTAAGGGAVNLDPHATSGRLVVSYVSATVLIPDLPYSIVWMSGNGDTLLQPGELAEVVVDVRGITPAIAAGQRFTLALRAGGAPPVTIERTMPGGQPLDAVVNLW